MLKIIVLGAILSIPLVTRAEPEIKGTPDELARYLAQAPRTTRILGDAELRVPAQRATVSMRVVTDHKSLQEALRQNAEVRTALSEHLRKRGIPADRVKASRFSSTPRFGMFGDKAKSYRVEHVVRIQVQDEKEFHVAAAAVDLWPEVQFAGLDFEFDDREALKLKALEKALENARLRKAVYEGQLQVTLVPVGIQESDVIVGNPDAGYYGMPKSVLRSGLSYGNDSVPAPEGTAPDSAVSSLGELVYTARVCIEYRIQPR